MNCKACRVEIEEADDARPLNSVASVHLESCVHCSTFREEHQAIKAMVGGLEVVSAPADFDFRLRARLADLKGQGRGASFLDRYAPNPRSLAIAAGLVVVFMIGLVVRQALLAPDANDDREQSVTSKPVENVVPRVPSPTPLPDEIRQEANQSLSKGSAKSVMVQAQRGGGERVNRIREGRINRVARDDVIESIDMGSTSPANSVLPPGIPDPLTLLPTTVAMQMRASIQPTTIVLKTGTARSQTISLRPVTFGGQDLFDQGSARKSIVPTVQGIW